MTPAVRDELAEALAEHGGAAAPRAAHAQLLRLLAERLARDALELRATRSGYGLPVTVGLAAARGSLLAAAPVPAALRADPAVAGDRARQLVSALAAALVAGTEPSLEPAILAGSFADEWLLLAAPGRHPDPELAGVRYEELIEGVDRLRSAAAVLPGHVLEGGRDPRPPIGAWHPLRVAEVVARLDGDPVDPESVEALGEAVVARIGARAGASRPHDDPLPERRVARRILQTLAGKGKWGGYHSEFVHVARGFEGNERRLALELGERLVRAGLLVEKRSVGQRHVFLNPRRAQEIYALVDEGAVPPGLDLS
ncbi:MAG: hypothetical protein WD844_07265 [Thermoleophilaceae bacterium]